MKSRYWSLRIETFVVKGQEFEERVGVKSMDRRLRKKTGEVKGQEIEESDG